MSLPRAYVCFDACGSKNPAATDLKYYFLLRAWSRRKPLARAFLDVHREAPRAPADMRTELARRLRESDLLLLILSERTRANAGWVPWEIDFAAAQCDLPIVCAYAGRDAVDEREGYRPWWPAALGRLASGGRARLLHAPFRPQPLAEALAALSAPRRSAGFGPTLETRSDTRGRLLVGLSEGQCIP